MGAASGITRLTILGKSGEDIDDYVQPFASHQLQTTEESSSDRNIDTEIQVINEILLRDSVDLAYLREVARRPGGFLNNSIRSRVWTKLLDINRYTISADFRSFIDSSHRDTSQIACDVDRSLWSTDVTLDWSPALRDSRRLVLSDIINSIVSRNTQLYYYQGYHDIVSIFMLVCEDDNLAFAMSQIVSIHYLSDYMNENFDTFSRIVQLVLAIIQHLDEELFAFFDSCKLEPFFATSWIIAWFSHDIKSLQTIARMFDVIISSHPSFTLYISVAIILHARTEILSLECDFATLHSFCSKLPSTFDVSTWETVIQMADHIMEQVPLSVAKTFTDKVLLASIHKKSVVTFLTPPMLVLKTAPADWILLSTPIMNEAQLH